MVKPLFCSFRVSPRQANKTGVTGLPVGLIGDLACRTGPKTRSHGGIYNIKQTHTHTINKIRNCILNIIYVIYNYNCIYRAYIYKLKYKYTFNIADLGVFQKHG